MSESLPRHIILLKIPPAGENRGRWSRIVLKRRAPSSCYNQIRRNRGAHLYCPRSAPVENLRERAHFSFQYLLERARHYIYVHLMVRYGRMPVPTLAKCERAGKLSLAGNLWSRDRQLGEQVKFAFVKEQRVFKKNYQLALVWWQRWKLVHAERRSHADSIADGV